MSGIIEFEIPGRLQAKQRSRYARKTGHMYTPKETVNAESYVREYFAGLFHTHMPFSGPVSVEIEFYRIPPVSWAKWKRLECIDGGYYDDLGSDLDNKAKTVLDALNHVAFTDDRQVCSLLVRKGFSARDFTLIRIEEYSQPVKPISNNLLRARSVRV